MTFFTKRELSLANIKAANINNSFLDFFLCLADYLMTSMSPDCQLIELPYQEIAAKTGVFRNPVTGTVWRVFIKDGKLMVDVPNFCFEISPLSTTKFRSVNTLAQLEMEFEHSGQNRPLLMHLYAQGTQRATFEAL